MQVSVGEKTNLGKHDFMTFPAATGQLCAEEWFSNKKGDNLRNYFVL